MTLSKWDENYPVCIKDGSPAASEHTNLCEYHSQNILNEDTTEYLTGKQFAIEIINGITCLALLVLLCIIILALAPQSVQ
jgi:hypothetical protein